MEKYGGLVLQDLGAATELDSSVPGEQKEAAGWFPGGFEDCSKDDLLASRFHQKRNAKFFRSMTSVAMMKVISYLGSVQGCWCCRVLPDEGAETFLGCNRVWVFSNGLNACFWSLLCSLSFLVGCLVVAG